jgi:hypothetical protein
MPSKVADPRLDRARREAGNDFLTETIANICKFAKYNERKKGWVRCDPPEWIASTLKQRKS